MYLRLLSWLFGGVASGILSGYIQNKIILFLILFVFALAILYILLPPLIQKLKYRISVLDFLKEDSATRSFDLFTRIFRQLVVASKNKDVTFIKQRVVPEVESLIRLRRQPMKIILDDCLTLLNQSEESNSALLPVNEQICYYLDFMRGYKKMA